MPANNKLRKEQARQRTELFSKLSAIKSEIDTARNTFNAVKEPDLVDACVYNLNALMSQYSYYLRCARDVSAPASRKERK